MGSCKKIPCMAPEIRTSAEPTPSSTRVRQPAARLCMLSVCRSSTTRAGSPRANDMTSLLTDLPPHLTTWTGCWASPWMLRFYSGLGLRDLEFKALEETTSDAPLLGPLEHAGLQGKRQEHAQRDGRVIERVELFRKAAGTAFYIAIDRPSVQFAMHEIMSGMSTRRCTLLRGTCCNAQRHTGTTSTSGHWKCWRY